MESAYDPADIEDHYETRLRALIDAKLKGEGIDREAEPQPAATNVIDLMAALRKSIAASDEQKPAEAAPTPTSKTVRSAKAAAEPKAAPPAKSSRKRA